MPNPVDGQFVKWAIGGACFVHTRTGKDVQVGVFSTPRDGDNHAKQIRRAVDRCPHLMEADNEDV